MTASPRVVEPGKPIPKGEAGERLSKPFKVAGKKDAAQEGAQNTGEGLASWYGGGFHGRLTANGEIFDKHALSAAHPSMPLPSYARVTNVSNGRSVVVRVNDRGPFHGNRALDVSERVAEMLDFKARGMAKVRIDYVGPASLKGSDDQKLLATYRAPDGTGIALASLMPTPAPPAQTPQPAVRVANSFSGFSSPQPLTHQGGMVQPVLSGFAFGPPALGGLE